MEKENQAVFKPWWVCEFHRRVSSLEDVANMWVFPSVCTWWRGWNLSEFWGLLLEWGLVSLWTQFDQNPVSPQQFHYVVSILCMLLLKRDFKLTHTSLQNCCQLPLHSYEHSAFGHAHISSSMQIVLCNSISNFSSDPYFLMVRTAQKWAF